MLRLTARRLLEFIPALILASMAIWGIIYLLPGSPATVIAGPNATPADVQAVAARLGLDRSVPQQYLIWISHVVHGNFGTSLLSNQPVSALIASRLPATIQLAVLSMLIALVISVPLGVVAAVWPHTVAGRLVNAYQATALAVPTFWVGILLILLFGLTWKVAPTASTYVSFWSDPLTALRNTMLPALTLGIFVSGVLSRFLAGTLSDELLRDYVRTARAKGLWETRVVLRHALRNALVPFVTVTGLQVGGFIGGTIVTEAVFDYPGVGSLIYSAISQRDYGLIQAGVLLIVVAFLVINLLVDLAYGYLDPRARAN
jgi:peptide/nickel transport system permease protein